MEQPDSPVSSNSTAAPSIDVSIFAVMLFQVFSLVVAAYAYGKIKESGVTADNAIYLGSLFGFVLLAIFMWPILRQNWHALKPVFARPASWPRVIIASIALGILLWLINTLVLIGIGVFQSFAVADLSNKASLVYSLTCESPLVLVLPIFAMSVITPVIEETINRGLILQALLPRGKWFATLISALLFMILHQPSFKPSVFAFGIVVAIQFMHWRNIWAVILTHGTINLLAVTQQHCGTKEFVSGEVTWEFGGVAQLLALSLLFCCGSAWWLATKCRTGTN